MQEACGTWGIGPEGKTGTNQQCPPRTRGKGAQTRALTWISSFYTPKPYKFAKEERSLIHSSKKEGGRGMMGGHNSYEDTRHLQRQWRAATMRTLVSQHRRPLFSAADAQAW